MDLQARQLVDMESSINHLSQTVSIHKEKVARREIGVLTTNKSFPRPVGVKSPGIIFPEQAEKLTKYIRKSIDYHLLDSVGSGGPKTGYRKSFTGSVSSAGGSSSGNMSVPRHTNTAPSASITSTLNRTTGPRRPNQAPIISPPVPPPTVPSHYMDTRELQGTQQPFNNPTYDYLPNPPGIPPAPPMDQPPPAPNNVRISSSAYQQVGPHMYNGDPVAPPPPISPMSPPPPPMPGVGEYDQGNRNSMPLPPPHPGTGRDQEPPWAPDSYMEKVVAIFDYAPQNEDELQFQENAILYVVKKNEDGWWEGVMEADNGQPICGLFPQNYVESLL